MISKSRSEPTARSYFLSNHILDALTAGLPARAGLGGQNHQSPKPPVEIGSTHTCSVDTVLVRFVKWF